MLEHLNPSAPRILAAAALTFSFAVTPAAAADDALVTESRGAVVKVAPNSSAPVREWDALKDGDRVIVPAGGLVAIFFPANATLYELKQPIEVTVKNGALLATSGAVPAPRNLHAAYRRLKVDGRELAQGSLVMRSGESVRIAGPEGIVSAEDARRFQWAPASEGFRLELAASSGKSVLVREVKGGGFDLPARVPLSARSTYIWGLAPAIPGSKPSDWTEFQVADLADKRPQPPRPTADDPRSEWLLYAAWLRSRGLNRAALRVAANAPAAR